MKTRETVVQELREACKAFKDSKDWPDAWLYLGEDDDDWYDSTELLMERPVFHMSEHQSPRPLGFDGERQWIIPIWRGDTSTKNAIAREFSLRLAQSGDF